MKLLLTSAILTSTAFAFAPLPTNTQIHTHLQSTAEPPQRIAPDAGVVPEWEDRPGLSPNEFMKSDESKKDLSGMWECPITRWDSEG